MGACSVTTFRLSISHTLALKCKHACIPLLIYWLYRPSLISELHLIYRVGSSTPHMHRWRIFPTLRVESRRPHASEEAPIDSLLTLCSSSTSADVFQAAFFRHTINNVRNIWIRTQSEGQAQAPAREIGTSYVLNDDLQFSLSTTRSPRAFTYPPYGRHPCFVGVTTLWRMLHGINTPLPDLATAHHDVSIPLPHCSGPGSSASGQRCRREQLAVRVPNRAWHRWA